MIYHFANFELDPDRFELRSEGKPVEIEPKSFDMLKLLVLNHSRTLTRDEMHNFIWQNRIVSDTTISQCIKSLRKVLGDDGAAQSFIKTHHGRGYQFVAKVDVIADENSEDSGLAKHSVPFVAVIPFRNISSDRDDDYFAEGISEDIITELSRFNDLRVIARHSSFEFRHHEAGIDEIARRLQVQYILQGSIRRDNQRIRINVQLVEAGTLNHVWSERYEARTDEIFEIQDQILNSLVATVGGKVREDRINVASRKSTENLNAYEHLLRGLSIHKSGFVSPSDYQRATDEFDKAIALDPGFARPRAWRVCSVSGTWDEPTADRLKTALEEAKYALNLDENESETHRILASLYLYSKEFEMAQYHTDEAIRLNPNDAHIIIKSSRFYAYTDQHKLARQAFVQATRLNPLHPDWYWQEAGIALYSEGCFDQSASYFKRNSQLSGYDMAYAAAAYQALGETTLANSLASDAKNTEPDSTADSYTRFEVYRDASKNAMLKERMISAGIPAG